MEHREYTVAEGLEKVKKDDMYRKVRDFVNLHLMEAPNKIDIEKYHFFKEAMDYNGFDVSAKPTPELMYNKDSYCEKQREENLIHAAYGIKDMVIGDTYISDERAKEICKHYEERGTLLKDEK